MNTKKEQNTSKEKIKAERRALTDEELEQVSGGAFPKNEVIQEVISIYDTGTVSVNAIQINLDN